jgi:hypothetical protein
VEDAFTDAFLRLYFEEDVSSDEEEDPVYPESSPGIIKSVGSSTHDDYGKR